MALDSDPVCDALFERLQDALRGKVTTFERRTLGGEKYRGRMPALELRTEEIPVEAAQSSFPPVWLLRFRATVYVDVPRDHPDPDKLLRAMVRGIELALEKRDRERSAWWTTLGGRCDAAYPNGVVDMYPDGEGGWSAVDVPIEVVVATKHDG